MMPKQKRSFVFLSTVLAAGVALTGCGGAATQQGSGSSQATTAGGGGQHSGGKILIATQSPLSGPQSFSGDSIKTGAQFAVELRKEEFKQLGFDLQLFPQDDQAEPKQGVANAEMLVANPDVLAVVGHLNTGVAIPSSVKYEEAGLVMVSPANTGVKLTEEGKKTVHRICARDDEQGPQGAKYAKNVLGVKKVFIIHDKTAYGQGIAEQVKKQFEADGVEVLGYEGITQGEKDYSAVLNQVVSKKPDMIYFGGMYPEGGTIVKQARGKGFTGIIMGGDGLDSPEMIKIAGEAVEGVIYSSTAGDVSQTEEGRKWIAEYEKTMKKKPESYSVYGFDAANVVLNGIREAIKSNGGKKPTREQVLAAVHATKDFKGQFTTVTFDEKGDNVNAAVYMYKFTKGKTEFLGKAE